jgi:hypothetical protein
VAIILCLPAVASLYIFGSGAWLTPDNAGWLGVLLAMMLALRRRVDAWTYIGSAILLLLLVFVRQIDLWVAAPLFMAAWLGSDETALVGNNLAARCRRVALALLAAIPSLLLLYTLFRLWHGLVPPTIRTSLVPNLAGGGKHHDGNPAVLPLILSTFALFSPFYLGWLASPGMETPATSNRPRRRISVAIGLIVGALAGVLPQTSYDETAGRWSGLWRLALHSPTVGNHSSVIVLLSTIGGGLLGYIFATLPRRDRCIFLTSWIAFCAAQFANHQVWQRYIDPFVLITMILMATRVGQWAESGTSGTCITAARSLPVILTLLLAVITIAALR